MFIILKKMKNRDYIKFFKKNKKNSKNKLTVYFLFFVLNYFFLQVEKINSLFILLFLILVFLNLKIYKNFIK
jgi:hypothetical protein